MKKLLVLCLISLLILAGCNAPPATGNTVPPDSSEGGPMVYTPAGTDRDTAIIQQNEKWLTQILSADSVVTVHESNLYTVTITGLGESFDEESATAAVHMALEKEAEEKASDTQLIYN